jgi:Short C-terminal domain
MNDIETTGTIDFRESGVITDAEFDAQKAKILAG